MMKKLKTILISSFALAFLAAPVAVVGVGSAQKVDVFNKVCRGGAANTAACKDSKAGKNGNPIYGPNGIITIIVNVISIIVGIAAVIGIIMAGFKLMTAGSNPQEVTKAREMILYAIVALVIVALAQAIIRFFINKVLT